MSVVWVTSDWHIGHRNIANFRHGISSVEENTDVILSDLHKYVTKRDIVYCLGDSIFKKEYIPLFSNLPGTYILVMGNHCNEKGKDVKLSDLLEVFDDIQGFMRKGNNWLSHCPIHPQELRGRNNIHGHTHHYYIDDPRYFNACVDNLWKVVGRSVIKLQEVEKIFREAIKGA